ncbi:hypothetical protein NW249_23725 [Streptomyces sp. OUCMDZ-4982]|uniref:hypothetical protein n=1 Tax=Streptomyces sp. OUCMDZ-4982 TaxID=2973090 RepID=UPI00215C1C0E|nr:hypothetical protein [Streptomyces sp. OUCMDZ-4982]MCR8945131.1 hypothetical protein [Streptomyces sp. OUCMDZ-4982]
MKDLPSRQAVRRKALSGFWFSVTLVSCGVAALFCPWWCVVVVAALTGVSFQATRTEWAVFRRGAPLLPLMDAIAPYTRDLEPGHTRVFDRIGADITVQCLAGRRAGERHFLRALSEELRAFDRPSGGPARVVIDQITISRAIVFQRTLVASSDPADPLQTRPLSRLQRLALMRADARTALLQPTAADMAALLDHLRNSDFVKDVPTPGAQK